MINELEIVIKLAAIAAMYDFAWWFGVNHEVPYEFAVSTGNKRLARNIIIFRIVKETLDFLILPLICVLFFDVSWNIIGAYYVAKWWHLSDSCYNIYRFIITNQPTSDGTWRWWTPLGLLRSIRVTRGKFHFEKAVVTTGECWIQAGIGLVLAMIIIQFKIVTFFINLF